MRTLAPRSPVDATVLALVAGSFAVVLAATAALGHAYADRSGPAAPPAPSPASATSEPPPTTRPPTDVDPYAPTDGRGRRP